jgi:CheY-like chemotaxis protein
MKNSDAKHKIVLLLDDDELVNFINQKVIETNNFSEKVLINTNAKSALEFLKNILKLREVSEEIIPEVIFVDINMPLIDGFQFIETVKKINNNVLQKIKFVVLTSSVHDLDRKKALEISDEILFLNKPLNKEKLELIP